MGTRLGLNILNRDTGNFARFSPNEDDLNGFGESIVIKIIEDSNTDLWIATTDGAYKYDREKDSFQQFTENDGLPSNTVTAIQTDNYGIVWFCTFNGIARYDPLEDTYDYYTVDDGLPTNTCRATYKAEDGQIYFGNQGGYVTFYPEDIINNPYIPPIVITDFLLLNESVQVGPDTVLPKALSEVEEVVLDHSDNVFSLEFAALHYSDPESNQYAYMLEGFDEDWIYTTSERRYVTYTNLSGGDYIFRVKGSNSDGAWNEEGVSLNIKIIPPFYDTTWFKILAFTLIVGTVFVGVRERILIIERRRQELEVLVEQKTEELVKAHQEELIQKERLAVLGSNARNISHELRNPLGVITNSVYFLKNVGDSASSEIIEKYYDIIEYETNISNKIITDLLEYGKDIEPDLKVTSISQLISNSLSRTPPPENAGIEVSVNVTPEDLSSLFDSMQLELALKNIFENAYHAMENGGTLSLKSFKQTNEIIIEISDTGSGISEDDFDKVFNPLFTTKSDGFGLGLSITRKFVLANNGNIKYTSKEGEGTTFTISLPATKV